MSSTGTPTVVIPSFNEASRLDVGALERLASPQLHVLLIDDGSTDGSGALLRELSTQIPLLSIRSLPSNVGKGEAVRQGLLDAIALDAPIVGYLDADMSTPPEEFNRLLTTLTSESSLDVVLGARVALLGHDIQRRARRHYLGRIFGTLASTSLRMPVYDTQCGAKAFRVTPALRSALRDPFRSRWVFDVELIGRLHFGSHGAAPVPTSAFREVPLHAWRDIPNGGLTPLAMGGALIDLARITAIHRRQASSFQGGG